MRQDALTARDHRADPPAAGPPVVTLRILATSDLHMHLAPYDYYNDRPCQRRGLALTATLIAEARREVPGSILIDNGDFLQGSPLGDYVARSALRPHPMIAAMAHLGYDAINLGNHEFSMGMDGLCAALSDAPFPVISANIRPVPSSALGALVSPWVIVDRMLEDTASKRHALRVGIIGVLPPETQVWDKQPIAGQVTMQGMTDTVARLVPQIRSAGADIILVAAHCGIGLADTDPALQDGALSIAAIDGVDAIVMGHSHSVFPARQPTSAPGVDAQAGALWGKPAVMPGFFGSHLGVMDLRLTKGLTGWQVTGFAVQTNAIEPRAAIGTLQPAVKPDPVLTALIDPVHRAACDWARRPIGHTPRTIHSFFAMVTDCPTVQLVNQAQAAYVAARLASGPYADLPVLSSSAPFRAGGLGGPENYTHIPPGDLLLRHAADLYIHPNTIMALRLDGASLLRWLEHAVRGYCQITPGVADQPLLRIDTPSFLFDTIGGLTYEIDLSQPAADRGGTRIRNLCHDGQPVHPRQTFVLATNSYRGSEACGHLLADAASVILSEETANRDILTAHLSRLTSTGADFWLASGWRFSPVAQTSVLFDTSPLAVGYLLDHPSLSLAPVQMTEDGFLTMRLTL